MKDKISNPFSTEKDETIERYQWFNLGEATLLKDLLESTYMANRKTLADYNTINQDYERIIKWKKLSDKLDDLINELKNAQTNPEDH